MKTFHNIMEIKRQFWIEVNNVERVREQAPEMILDRNGEMLEGMDRVKSWLSTLKIC